MIGNLTKRGEKSEEIWLRSEGFNTEFKSLEKVQKFGLIRFRDKKKEKQQQKSTPIEDFKLGRQTFTNFENGVHETYWIQNPMFSL